MFVKMEYGTESARLVMPECRGWPYQQGCNDSGLKIQMPSRKDQLPHGKHQKAELRKLPENRFYRILLAWSRPQMLSV
jgi:hypothetical protein